MTLLISSRRKVDEKERARMRDCCAEVSVAQQQGLLDGTLAVFGEKSLAVRQHNAAGEGIMCPCASPRVLTKLQVDGYIV